MTRDEIVTALRCCASSEADCKGNCAFFGTSSPNEDCSQKKNTAAADLIEAGALGSLVVNIASKGDWATSLQWLGACLLYTALTARNVN